MINIFNENSNFSFNKVESSIIKDIPKFSIIISNQKSKSNNIFTISNVISENFHDPLTQIMNIVCKYIDSTKENITKFVNENWHGIGNSFKRFFGFGAQESRISVYYELKRLGDIYLSCEQYETASTFYQQLFSDFTIEDILN